jgi:hypothetical protein
LGVDVLNPFDIGMSAFGPWRAADAVFKLLIGRWLFDRSVDNGASMTGAATFSDQPNGQLEYQERGRLRLPDGRSIDGERRYIFESNDDGFSVLFDETPPRLFHHIALNRLGSSLAGNAVHFCGKDRYDSRYEFRADGSFMVKHAVDGPRKHYAIATRYARWQ